MKNGVRVFYNDAIFLDFRFRGNGVYCLFSTFYEFIKEGSIDGQTVNGHTKEKGHSYHLFEVTDFKITDKA